MALCVVTPVFNVPMWNVKLVDIICALSQESRNKTGGYVVENTGLHWTDKRFAEASNISFVKGVPMTSIVNLRSHRAAMAQAIKGRAKTSTPLSVRDYETNLIVRCIRGQILNPIMRTDFFATYRKTAERLRSVAMGHQKRFLRMAANPINISYLTNWLIHG